MAAGSEQDKMEKGYRLVEVYQTDEASKVLNG